MPIETYQDTGERLKLWEVATVTGIVAAAAAGIVFIVAANGTREVVTGLLKKLKLID